MAVGGSCNGNELPKRAIIIVFDSLDKAKEWELGGRREDGASDRPRRNVPLVDRRGRAALVPRTAPMIVAAVMSVAAIAVAVCQCVVFRKVNSLTRTPHRRRAARAAVAA